ncbi:hypothetical protein LXJ15735_35090 [Lacrimispora xylanolytica]
MYDGVVIFFIGIHLIIVHGITEFSIPIFCINPYNNLRLVIANKIEGGPTL